MKIKGTELDLRKSIEIETDIILSCLALLKWQAMCSIYLGMPGFN
jgi:hypothetical protein